MGKIRRSWDCNLVYVCLYCMRRMKKAEQEEAKGKGRNVGRKEGRKRHHGKELWPVYIAEGLHFESEGSNNEVNDELVE